VLSDVDRTEAGGSSYLVLSVARVAGSSIDERRVKVNFLDGQASPCS
jgi:hypothetical protein